MLTFSYNMSDYWNLKIEPYAQWLFNVPVEHGTSYSVLNRFEFYLDKALENEGRGENFGVDMTLERYLHNGWYGMLNGSFFRSRYKGGDGVWRHSAFDRNYIVNLLCGKEWMLGAKRNNMLSVNKQERWIIHNLKSRMWSGLWEAMKAGPFVAMNVFALK